VGQHTGKNQDINPSAQHGADRQLHSILKDVSDKSCDDSDGLVSHAKQPLPAPGPLEQGFQWRSARLAAAQGAAIPVVAVQFAGIDVIPAE